MDEWSCTISSAAVSLWLPLFTLQKGSQDLLSYTTRRGATKGTIETLVDELKDKYRRPLPAADLLLPKAYAELTEGVTDVKDLGSGVVGGVECDHLAFRKKDVDFQIWIAQGQRPYPCRYMISSTTVPGSPQYSVQISNFQTGSAAVGQSFSFVPPKGARAISKDELKTIKSMVELPSHFTQGGTP